MFVLFASAIVVSDCGSIGSSSKREIRKDFLSGSEKDPVDGAMWFGPRLGRRKRSEEGDDEEEESAERDKTDKTLVTFFRDAPWAFVAGVKGTSCSLKSFRKVVSLSETNYILSGGNGKKRTLSFTPRLGRDSEEEYGENSVDSGRGKSSSRSGSHGTGNFLSASNFTPRLGRYVHRFFERDRL